MRKASIFFMLSLVLFTFGVINAYAQPGCGNAITKTSSFPYLSAHGTLSVPQPTGPPVTRNNDFTRLNAIISTCQGKIIFDEPEYYINDTLNVFGARLLEGSGANILKAYPSSKIIQMANKPIFKIGTGVLELAIRDMALIGGLPTRTLNAKTGQLEDSNTNMFGILAESGPTTTCTEGPPANYDNCSSIGFQFSNLSFTDLNKGFYLNAQNDGEWQFDNVRIDHARFNNCIIGIHLKSYNSGFSMSSLNFSVPKGEMQGDEDDIDGKTYGIYLEKSTYTSMDLLIGGGPDRNFIDLGTALIYVRDHANLNIQSIVAEGFHDDVVIHGRSRNAPINLINSTLMSGVFVRNATLYSSSNQYSSINDHGAPAIAEGYAQIYSIGDKYCLEGDDADCYEARGFELNATADGTPTHIFLATKYGTRTTVPLNIGKNIYNYPANDNINKFTSAPALTLIAPNIADGPLMRLGKGKYFFDISRSELDSTLTFTPGDDQVGYGYTFNNRGGFFNITGGDLKFSDDAVNSVSSGTLTLGTTTFLNLGTATNGTLWYCSDCQQTSSCASGGSGAIAKRIAGNWQCN